MDIATLSTIVGIILSGIMAVIGYAVGGFICAIMLATITIIGLSVIPATPIIPIWIAVLIIAIEVLAIAFKVGSIFGLGKGE